MGTSNVDDLDDLAFYFVCDLNGSGPLAVLTFRMNAMDSILAYPYSR